jgi:phosphate transport system substrate-binding protein
MRGAWAPALLCVAAIYCAKAGAADSAFEAEVAASLPRYEPRQQVAGVIRIWGHGHIKLPWMKPLVRAWEKGFQRSHPGVSIDYQMHGTSSGIPALFTGIGDIAILGEEILPEAVAAFERVRHYPPTGIEVATGSYDVRNFDYAQMFFVHKDNPLAKITLAEIDAIFGEEHRRGARNLRTWGELGLGGEWAGQAITPYGWRIDDSFGFYIQEAVLGGSHRWNCALREYAHIYRTDGTIHDHGQQILDALAKDRHGIAVSNVRYAGPDVKALALAADSRGPYVAASKRSLIDRSYPLVRTIPAVVDRAPGEPLDPKVREFLSYVLSREGQEAIVADGRYLPLSAEFAAEQRGKLR